MEGSACVGIRPPLALFSCAEESASAFGVLLVFGLGGGFDFDLLVGVAPAGQLRVGFSVGPVIERGGKVELLEFIDAVGIEFGGRAAKVAVELLGSGGAYFFVAFGLHGLKSEGLGSAGEAEVVGALKHEDVVGDFLAPGTLRGVHFEFIFVN